MAGEYIDLGSHLRNLADEAEYLERYLQICDKVVGGLNGCSPYSPGTGLSALKDLNLEFKDRLSHSRLRTKVFTFDNENVPDAVWENSNCW